MMIFDNTYFDQRCNYDTEAFLMVVRDLDCEHFRKLCRNMDTVNGDENYRAYLNAFIDNVIKFRRSSEYNIFCSLVKHLFPETDGVIPDAVIAKKKFLYEKDLSKYRIYLLMLLEQFIRSYFVDEKNFGDYWHLFKLYD